MAGDGKAEITDEVTSWSIRDFLVHGGVLLLLSFLFALLSDIVLVATGKCRRPDD